MFNLQKRRIFAANKIDSTENNMGHNDYLELSEDGMTVIRLRSDYVGSVVIPDGTIEIERRAFYGCTGLTSIEIPSSVEVIGGGAFCGCTSLSSLEIPSNVTEISNNTFYGCTNLTSIKLPDSLRIIWNYAFFGCTSLVSIEIPSSVKDIRVGAFDGCSRLKEIMIDDKNLVYCSKNGVLYSKDISKLIKTPEGKDSITIHDNVREIGHGAFSGCTKLASIKIPEKVWKIGNKAFYGCTKLNEIVVDEKNPYFCSKDGVLYSKDMSSLIAVPLDKDTINIPDCVSWIRDYAFSGVNKLKSIEIPKKVTCVGSNTFSYCTSLSWIDIPSSVTEIGDCAFEGCTSLSSIEIPGSVKEIGYYAFKGCISLSSIAIPSSVTKISTSSFLGCTGMKEILVDLDNPNYYDDNGVLYTKDLSLLIFVPNRFETFIVPNKVTSIQSCSFSSCTSLASIKIPNSVKEIGSSAFSGCTSLSSIEIPYGIKEIRLETFVGCTSLASIKIPNSVKEIGRRAFSGCTSLSSIEIPYSVEKIEINTFEGCANLKEIHFKRNVPLDISHAFDGIDISMISLYVPNGSVEAYRNHKFYSGFKEVFINMKQYDYLYLSDDDRTVIGCRKDYNGEVVIPNSVLCIGQHAFAECRCLSSIKIPSSVTWISGSAFKNCMNLTSIKIHKCVNYIGEMAFFGCSRIINITVDSENPLYCDKEGVLYSKDLSKLIFVPVKFGTFIVPNSVTEIESGAFSYCTNLTSIKIPNSVISIGDMVFFGCSRIINITVDSENPQYCDKEGVLYSKDLSKLIFVPNIFDTFFVPNNITSMASGAFSVCSSLIELHLRHKTPIDFSKAFEGLNLSKITLYVPIGSGSDYRHHPFYSKFKEVVTEK